MTCPSSGCNYQPYSQSQKMSIGIVVDSVAKPRCGSLKQTDVSSRHAEKEPSDVQRGVKASCTGAMCENNVQEGSVRVSASSLAANLQIRDSDYTETQAFRPVTRSLHGKQPTHTRQSIAIQPLLEPGVGKKTDADSASGKESKRAFMKGTSEKFSYAPKQQVCLPNEMENRSKEVLRLKLREILGTVPSGNMILGDSRTCEENATEMMREQPIKGDAHFKPRQNSDTIETDSENVDMTIKRPVAHSLARRRAPVRMWPRNCKPKSLSSNKEEHQGRDIFSFAEKSGPSQPCADRGFSLVEDNDCAKRSCGIKPGDMLSPVTDLKNTQPEKRGCEQATPIDELPFGGGVTFSKHDYLDENLEPEAAMPNINFKNSLVAREKSQLQNAESAAPQEKSEFFEPFGDQSPVPLVEDLSCPWFKMTKTVLNSPMGAYSFANDNKQDARGSAKPEGDADKLEDIHSSSPESSTEEKNAGYGLFTPVRGELGSSEEVSSSKKVYPEVDDIQTSPKIRLDEKPVLLRNKRHCNHGVDFSDFSPTLHTPKAGGYAADLFTECLDDNPEDGLARVVSLLGLALEKVKTKMVSMTNQKCSEILVSAAEEIHSQLRNVESQIQTDLGKLTSLKTSKRKHLETRLQEQQEHLKFMHEKFKEEISQYLQDCKGAMEGLETQHIELQGAVKRQKALHRKLLLQTEAAVETHLIDAQRQMMFVRTLGKQKMQQLKAIIAECLKDGISR